MTQDLNIAVVIATLGRPEVASGTVRRIIERQTLKPSTIIISCVQLSDSGEAATRPEVRVLQGPAGLAAQRNTALEALPDDIDIVIFFDDDFVPDPNWLAAAARLFRAQPDVVGLTGDVLADGIKGPGLSFAEVDRMLQATRPSGASRVVEPFSPYGCNMAFRRAAIGALRFDERLILYGWLEDRDFGAALAAKGGRIIKSYDLRGVHMGVKSGRMAGGRLGYSQVINPIYMLRKGTITQAQVINHLFRNIASNVVLSALPEKFVDSRGRLRGNIRALADLLSGKIEPERAKLSEYGKLAMAWPFRCGHVNVCSWKTANAVEHNCIRLSPSIDF